MLEISSLRIEAESDNEIVNILYDINLKVRKGEVLGIAGESGSGKTVLGKHILGINELGLKVVSGTLIVDSKKISSIDDYRSIRGKKVSMIFQDATSSLNPVFTIGQQLIESIMLSDKKLSKTDARKLAIKYLAEVEIEHPEDRLNSYPHQLSGGMNQRVMIALAISTKPEILIADEPTTALDNDIANQIVKLILKLNKESGLTVIFISHDISLIERISDRILIIYSGEVLELLSKADIESGDIKHPYTLALRECIPSINDKGLLKTIKGQISKNTVRYLNSCIFYERCNNMQYRCSVEKPKFDGRAKCHFPLQKI